MGLTLLGLGSANAPHDYPQPRLCELAEPCVAETPRQRRLLPALYDKTGVQRRQSVIEIGAYYDPPGPNQPNNKGPTTAERMRSYYEHAIPLAADASTAALADAGLAADRIGQLVAVSCTGFVSPGLDLGLMHGLDLPATAGRTQLGFMGCHGALSGLRAAHGLAQSHPDEPVLLCCCELCTLHFQYGWDTQQVVANALFGDGAAACVGLACDEPQAEPKRPTLVDSASAVLPGSDEAMSWVIGDHGFRMTLSPRVPELIREHLPGFLTPWLSRHGLTPNDIGGWAIHPGGPRVIRAVETSLSLPDDAGDASRTILRDHGNMSSPTILFILQRLQQNRVPRPWVGLAFGPGLTIEAALIR